MDEKVISTIDTLNFRALGVAELALLAYDNGLDIDVSNSLEVIRDYLKHIDSIFSEHSLEVA
ncbi:MAG: hypothetical protein IKW21_00440 [Lachnospiraceae bacterium]|nr:hypothetical protein [Lachnospiraceae bacterium]